KAATRGSGLHQRLSRFRQRNEVMTSRQDRISPPSMANLDPRLGENFLKKGAHCDPRPCVGLRVVGSWFRMIRIEVPIRKAMDGISIADQSPIHFCLAHLFLEGEHLGIRNKRIVSAMQDEDPTLDVFGVLRPRGVEGAMKRNDACQICAVARKFENERAPDAISNPGKLARVHLRKAAQYIQPGPTAPSHQLTIALILSRFAGAIIELRGSHPL